MLYIFSTVGSEVVRRLMDMGWNVDVRFCQYGDSVGVCDKFSSDDFVMLRWDSVDVNESWFSEVRQIVTIANGVGARVFDADYWIQLPRMRDKYVQAMEYARAGIPHIDTVVLSEFSDGDMDYPLLVKKRMGGKGIGSFIVRNNNDLRYIVDNVDSSEYVIQPYKRLAKDLRVVIFGGEIYGVVNRNVVEKSDGSVKVKVSEVVELSDEEMEVVERYMFGFKPEFVGLDVLVDDSGYIWITECNYSPLYSGFERVSGRDVIADMKNVLESVVLG